MALAQEKTITIEEQKSQKKTPLIGNTKERKRMIFTLLLTLAIVAVFVAFTPYFLEHYPIGSRAFKRFVRSFGSISERLYFLNLAIFPVFYLLKKNILPIKKILTTLAKYLRQWHVPLATLATGIVGVHGYFALLNNENLFKPVYITGYITTLALLFLAFSGIFKYKKRNGKSHLVLGITFTVLFLIHSAFA